MKKNDHGQASLWKNFLLPVLSVLFVTACVMNETDLSEKDLGKLRISFAGTVAADTRVLSEIPDTGAFILTITDSEGNVIYDGLYGDSPEMMMVKPGSYVVKAVSCEFSRPAFSSPQFGDEQCVLVPSGGVADVRLTCSQMNSGVKLNIDESFLVSCPQAALFLKASSGKLMYSYSEKRIAYFQPGNISLVLSESSADKILMTRNLHPQEILKINLSAVVSGSSQHEESIKVAVDTTRHWLYEDYVIGGEHSKGDEIENAMTVNQAMASVGEEDVWVSGYVVGGDLTHSSASFQKPFESKTNILLGSRSSVKDRETCISVALPGGRLREEMNLVDNPEILGRKVFIRGDIVESYYGLVGLKNITDFEMQ